MVAKKSDFLMILWLDSTLMPIYNRLMPDRSRKDSSDVNQLAKSIVDKVTTEELVQKATKEGKNPAAVMLGRLGGLKGGKARAAKLTTEKRKEIARKAANSRWSKIGKKETKKGS